MIRNTRIQSGFSLIELAIVLFILSLLLGSLLPPLSAQIEQKRREETQAQLEDIKEVLFGFALKQSRLPCPDCSDNTSAGCSALSASEIGDGKEDIISGDDCANESGNLPWASLGVRESDAWGQHFIYRVTNNFADSDDETSCTYNTLNVSFSLCSDGDILINDENGNTVAQYVPALVFSRGQNYADTGSTFEQENTDEDNTFIYMDYSNDNTNGYDDLMIWISPYLLRTKMLNAGILP